MEAGGAHRASKLQSRKGLAGSVEQEFSHFVSGGTHFKNDSLPSPHDIKQKNVMISLPSIKIFLV